MDKMDALQTIRLFEGLDEAEYEVLRAVAQWRRKRRGEYLFQAGDPGDGFFAVISGRVKVFRTSDTGKEQILHVLGPGEVFAEVAVFEGRTYPADAAALEDGELLFFPRSGIREQMRQNPELALKMLGLLAGRLRKFVAQIDALSLKEVPSRLAAYLLLLPGGENGRVRLELPKGQVAAYLGTIQETLSRAFRRLEKDGLIAVHGGEVAILDREGLEDAAARGR